MNQSKEIRASHLFDAIGDIEDRYIAEAEMPYSPQRRYGRLLARLLPAALCLTVLAGVSVSLVTGRVKQADSALTESMMEDRLAYAATTLDDGDAGSAGSSALTSNSISPSLRLSKLLESAEASPTDKSGVTLDDGIPKLVWQVTGEDKYYARALTEEQLNALTEEMARKTGATLVAPATVSLRIWIVTAEGAVLTPHSTEPPRAELFDYEPSVEPSAALVEQIEKILSTTK